MKIRVEYEVPEDDCEKCEKYGVGCYSRIPFCKRFDVPLELGQYRKYKRCQPCIEAEVKEGE